MGAKENDAIGKKGGVGGLLGKFPPPIGDGGVAGEGNRELERAGRFLAAREWEGSNRCFVRNQGSASLKCEEAWGRKIRRQ